MKETCQASKIRRKLFPKSKSKTVQRFRKQQMATITLRAAYILYRDTGRGENGEQGWNFPAAVVDTGAYTYSSITKVK